MLHNNAIAGVGLSNLPRRVLVTGATNQIGFFLLPLLRAEGIEVTAVSRGRNAVNDATGIQWVVADLETDNPFAGINPVDTWFHLAWLPLAIPWLKAASRAGVGRFVGFSSLSIFSKQDSPCREERLVVRSLRQAEEELAGFAAREGFSRTIMRPTMIYGCGMDQNIGFIMKVVRQFGCFPLVHGGRGRRQPVHAEDLALVALAAACSPVAANRAYNLGGGERLSYRTMVERIFAALGRKPRIIMLPPFLARFGVRLLRLRPGFRHLIPAMFDRMAMDLVVDHHEAARDLGYTPRLFIVPFP